MLNKKYFRGLQCKKNIKYSHVADYLHFKQLIKLPVNQYYNTILAYIINYLLFTKQ